MAKKPPIGPDWIHEIKHDGFRIMGRRDAAGPRLISRNGHDFSERFPFINLATGSLPAKSCLIDGEAIVTNEAGLADFELMRRQRTNALAVLVAFDLLELNDEDLRGLPIERRKRELARLLKKAQSHVVLNEHYEADGVTVFREARLRRHRIEEARVRLSVRPV